MKHESKCFHCHECGHPLKKVLDGEEWCPVCQSYRRYRSHGWTHALADKTPCLTNAQRWWAKETNYDLKNKPIPF